ncbi:PHA/PHB synthase family protein [Kordiimonas pumila]|uniref:PHA/PHB synthase family protein n=1 Tax=Kordiimonas pumila TaxID=2161677 RepID=A0ABV7D8K6_9PROT|nr:class I poly(R)-hydroxyalkanoic acid synthase [Kordiimonas pumila]
MPEFLQDDAGNFAKLKANFEKLDELTKRLVDAIGQKEPSNLDIPTPSSEFYSKAMMAYFSEVLDNPAKLIEQQVGYWQESVNAWAEAQSRLFSKEDQGTPSTPTKDKRFKSPLWETHPYFSYVKQQYLLSSTAIEEATQNLSHLSPSEQRRIKFFTRQIVDLFAPSNFLATNPEALNKAVETGGQSLVDGLEKLVKDLEDNDGRLAVTLTDPDAFEIGKNIATTEGSVVFQNRMFQLIQYKPLTETVFKTPLLILPPWINKYYILDMKPENSMVKYLVEQGYTVFIVSWVNPDSSYRDVGIDTYLEEGLLTALNTVLSITGEEKANIVGYCVGGTLLAIALAWMAKKKINTVKSATFFTTLTDFEDPGELNVFIEEGFLTGIEKDVDEKGYMDSFYLTRTFSFLRANDLVYGPAIRSYMMGEAPPVFDLLYWNSDSPNLPARMTKEYLRGLYMNNDLAEGRFTICGEKLSLKAIRKPLYAIATESDHIAPWKASFKGLSQTRGKSRFILSQSGHIAGVVNPASADKYGHWTNNNKPEDIDRWKNEATFAPTSWWRDWTQWLEGQSGKQESARIPGSEQYHIIEPAPGSYVVKR